jgi:hypothetical protein
VHMVIVQAHASELRVSRSAPVPTRAQAVAGTNTDTHLTGVASVVGTHTGATQGGSAVKLMPGLTRGPVLTHSRVQVQHSTASIRR